MDRVVKAVKAPVPPEPVAKADGAKPADLKIPPQFVNPYLRTMIIPLDWPIEYDGQIFTQVTLRRPTMKEWVDYNKQLAQAISDGGEEAGDLVDQPFYDVPAVVMNMLDFTDGARVEETTAGFFSSSRSTSTEVDTSSPSENGKQSLSS